MANIAGYDVTGMGSAALSIFVLIMVLIFVAVVVGAVAYLFVSKSKYEKFKVIIYSEDGFKQLVQRHDTATIHIDKKTGNKRFFVKKASVGLEADNFPYVMGSRGDKTVYLLQTGLKNFRFINIKIDVPRVELKVGEEDVNWALNEFDRAIKMFDAKDKMLQYMPYIILAFVSIVILIMFIYFFKSFPQLVEMSAQLKEAMMYGAQAAASNSGTTIIGG